MSLRQWTLCKDAETFIFRCAAGGQGQLLAEVADQVARGKISLSEADLAALVRGIVETIPPGESAAAVMAGLAQQAVGDAASVMPRAVG